VALVQAMQRVHNSWLRSCTANKPLIPSVLAQYESRSNSVVKDKLF